MKSAIKIVHFISRIEYGGVESVLLNYFSHIQSDKFEVHLISQDIVIPQCLEQFKQLGFHVHIVTHKRKSLWKNTYEIWKILRTERFDITHSHMTLTNFYVLFLAWLCKCKIRISHSHNAFIPKNRVTQLKYTLLKFINKLPANFFFACGIDAATFLFGEKKLPSVYLLNNAIDYNKFKFNPSIRETVRKELNIENKFCIGHIGRFSTQKNHKYIIELTKELKKEIPNLVVLSIGSGELQHQIEEEVKQNSLSDYFLFIGPTNSCFAYYQAMDIFILPSIFEGLPVVGIEAQMAGLHCIFSSNIDNRIILSNKSKLLSIKEKQQWCNEIFRLYKDRNNKENDRKFDASTVQKLGLDINTEAKKLEEFYLEQYTQFYMNSKHVK